MCEGACIYQIGAEAPAVIKCNRNPRCITTSQRNSLNFIKDMAIYLYVNSRPGRSFCVYCIFSERWGGEIGWSKIS